MHTQVHFRDILSDNAVFDGPGNIYRYWLTRQWDLGKPKVAFIMLNPSTADAERNDPTIRRCMGFARQWGFGGLIVVNLFAYRTPSVLALKSFNGDIIGPHNKEWILQACVSAHKIVCAWGSHGDFMQRGREVTEWLLDRRESRPSPFTLYCLGPALNNGQPRHPLYTPYNIGLETYK